MINRCIPVFAIVGLGALPVTWAALDAQRLATNPPAQVDFVRDIQPILQNTCYECHGPKKTKADLRLDSPAGVMKGGAGAAQAAAGPPAGRGGGGRGTVPRDSSPASS